MSPQDDLGRRHAVGRDFLIPLLVGIVGLSGSLGGVVVANSNNARQAEFQSAIDLQGRILDQRLALIDRSAKIFGESEGLSVLSAQNAAPNSETHLMPDRHVEISERLMEAEGEFHSVIFLAHAFFGPKTKAAIASLDSNQGKWWMKPKTGQNRLIDAMLEESWYNLDALTELLGREK
jgi:hypothetical protein